METENFPYNKFNKQTKMSIRKRNEWLEPEDDEDEQSLNEDSDEGERSKAQLASRSIKRRRVDDGSDEEEEILSEDEELDRSVGAIVKSSRQTPGAKQADVETKDDRFSKFADFEDGDGEHDAEALDSLDAQEAENTDEDQTVTKPKPVITSTQIAAKAKAKKKSGVIYLSRIPPFMKPQTLRTYLSPHGEIGKLFLTPEDHATYQRRVRSGGNKKHSYIDGWVEFLSKKDAKLAASVLNGNIMGGKKGSYYHDDIWNIKYLKGFKWDDLTEQISRENKEREARLRNEIARAKRENEGFVRDVERGKMLEGIRGKKGGNEGGVGDMVKDGERERKGFRQNVVKEKKAKREVDGRSEAVLSRIF